MKNHKGCVRAYIRSNKAWYAKTVHGKRVSFGMYAKRGGTTGEMEMIWEELAGEIVPQLRVWNDGWNALSKFPDLIKELGKVDDKNITEEEFVAILDKCNFKDFTAYKMPD